MNEKMKEQWAKFLAGHWTSEQPKKIGRYLTVTNAGVSQVALGVNGGFVRIVEDFRRNLQIEGFSHGFSGYWWSEEMPELPACTGDVKD